MTEPHAKAATRPSADAITVPDHSRPFSTMCLTIGRGSIDDPADKAGVAWLTAQMLLRGAEGMSRQHIADSLEGLGSMVDLSVGRDHTMLWADALNRKRPELLGYLDTILARPTFPDSELDKLKRETLADLQSVRDDSIKKFTFQNGDMDYRIIWGVRKQYKPAPRPTAPSPTPSRPLTRDLNDAFDVLLREATPEQELRSSLQQQEAVP